MTTGKPTASERRYLRRYRRATVAMHREWTDDGRLVYVVGWLDVAPRRSEVMRRGRTIEPPRLPASARGRYYVVRRSLAVAEAVAARDQTMRRAWPRRPVPAPLVRPYIDDVQISLFARR
jgi:hypothetical protein